MLFLKQSTIVDVVLGPFIDDTDGKTTEEALTLAQADLQLTKNGSGRIDLRRTVRCICYGL